MSLSFYFILFFNEQIVSRIRYSYIHVTGGHQAAALSTRWLPAAVEWNKRSRSICNLSRITSHMVAFRNRRHARVIWSYLDVSSKSKRPESKRQPFRTMTLLERVFPIACIFKTLLNNKQFRGQSDTNRCLDFMSLSAENARFLWNTIRILAKLRHKGVVLHFDEHRFNEDGIPRYSSDKLYIEMLSQFRMPRYLLLAVNVFFFFFMTRPSFQWLCDVFVLLLRVANVLNCTGHFVL